MRARSRRTSAGDAGLQAERAPVGHGGGRSGSEEPVWRKRGGVAGLLHVHAEVDAG